MSASSTTPLKTWAVSTTIGQVGSCARSDAISLTVLLPDDPVDDVRVVLLRTDGRKQIGGPVEGPGVVAAGLEVSADRVGEVLVVVEHRDGLSRKRPASPPCARSCRRRPPALHSPAPRPIHPKFRRRPPNRAPAR